MEGYIGHSGISIKDLTKELEKHANNRTEADFVNRYLSSAPMLFAHGQPGRVVDPFGYQMELTEKICSATCNIMYLGDISCSVEFARGMIVLNQILILIGSVGRTNALSMPAEIKNELAKTYGVFLLEQMMKLRQEVADEKLTAELFNVINQFGYCAFARHYTHNRMDYTEYKQKIEPCGIVHLLKLFGK